MERDVMSRVRDHYEESLLTFPEDRIVGIFLQGSQNYGLQIEGSDVDTKLIVLPTFENIVFNDSPVSTTHIRENDEHIDFKDVRLYFDTFRKQNLNFLEILFTDYKIVNPLYEEFWNELIAMREEICHYNPCRSVKSMEGIAKEKYHAMEHRYPSKIEILDKYGYDPKQLHHLCRVEEYIERYIAGEPYIDCLKPHSKDFLLDIKRGKYSLEEARIIGERSLEHINQMCKDFYDKTEEQADEKVEQLLKSVLYKIMKKGILKI